MVMGSVYDMKGGASLSTEIAFLCERFQKCSIEVESYGERSFVVAKLRYLCKEGERLIDTFCPELLVALLDAYEILRDEEILRKVLETVSQNKEQFEPSWKNVRLLALCYYYTEDEECAEWVKSMIAVQQKREGKMKDDPGKKILEECREIVPGIEF